MSNSKELKKIKIRVLDFYLYMYSGEKPVTDRKTSLEMTEYSHVSDMEMEKYVLTNPPAEIHVYKKLKGKKEEMALVAISTREIDDLVSEMTQGLEEGKIDPYLDRYVSAVFYSFCLGVRNMSAGNPEEDFRNYIQECANKKSANITGYIV
ncbi:MAG: hypothetical protein DRP13_03155 [Candidatus Aenigmatarchaeota archaeon]|nr:MAG: hypothetical protein DRP13_03155 [Candidatus Aenigmarchaeota archaeon]